MIPTVGRIVLYTLTEDDAEHINQRRMIGAQAHIGNDVAEGYEFPMIIVHPFMAIMRGDDIRTKGDLRDWTGSPTFHLDQSSPSKQGTKP